MTAREFPNSPGEGILLGIPWSWYMLVSAEGTVLCLVWFRPTLWIGLGFGEYSAQAMWYFWLFLWGWSSITPKAPDAASICRWSITGHTRSWRMSGCLPSCAGLWPWAAPLPGPDFSSPDGRGGSRQGNDQLMVILLQGGTFRVGTQALWAGFLESQPGPVLWPQEWAHWFSTALCAVPVACPWPLHGLMVLSGRAGASLVWSAELQETWGGRKAVRGYQGFGSWTAVAAVPTEGAPRACFLK